MNPDDLERLIDRELKQLPSPRAPGTLLPRVLAATAARKAAPSYAERWFNWPRRWRLAAVAVLVLITAGAGTLGYVWWPQLDSGLAWLRGASGNIARVGAAAQDGATLVRACWRVLLGPATFSLLVITLSLSFACAALWAALERVSLRGASEP
jgi:hypothetical protein